MSYFPLKNWDFETPLPIGNFVNLPWGGYGYFLEMHNTNSTSTQSIMNYRCSSDYIVTVQFQFNSIDYDLAVTTLSQSKVHVDAGE